MESFLPASGLRDLEFARDAFLTNEKRWRVIYHNDGDGVAAASVLATALLRLGKSFQLTPFTEVELSAMKSLEQETRGPILVVDTGSSLLSALDHHTDTVLVLDHHKPSEGAGFSRKEHSFVNPHRWGIDGMNDLCGSMLAYLFAKFLDERNVDLILWALSGAIADRQHFGGFRGVNLSLVKDAEMKGKVSRERGLLLMGGTVGEALTSSVDPYFVGLSGSKDETRKHLTSLGIDPDATVSSLNATQREKLSSALLTRLISQGTRPEFCEAFTGDSYQIPAGKLDAQTASLLQNATARENEPSVGIAMALGDPKALARAWELEKNWRAAVLQNLRRLEQTIDKKRALQWFYVSEAALGGAVAGLGLNYFLDSTRPAFALGKRGGVIKVSARGTKWLVEQGLDLDQALREAAQSVQGEGGGHRVASGATIPPGSEERFLDKADELLSVQLSALKRT
jgi:RecJ-like exonuclease